MSEFKVKVSVVCNRTGKQELKEMSIEEAQKFNLLKAQRDEMASEVEGFIAGLPVDTRPDLILSFRGQTVVLPTVLERKSDAGILRLLHELVPTVFPEIPAVPRKKSGNNGKSMSDTSGAD